MMQKSSIRGYHYTLSHIYEEMKSKNEDLLPKTELIWDNIPRDFVHEVPKRFWKRNGTTFDALGEFLNLPSEAFQPVIKCLLEPEPASWINNPEFPELWERFMFGVFHYVPALDWPALIEKDTELVLLSFDIYPTDKAYVFEEAYARRIHHSPKSGRTARINQIKKGCRNYWESRIPLSEYVNSYSLPVLSVYNPIEFERLKVECTKPAREIDGINLYLG